MMSVGRCTFSTRLAMVKVLPLPVMPSRTWWRACAAAASESSSMALGWSPQGRKSETILKLRDIGSTENVYRSRAHGANRRHPPRARDQPDPRALEMGALQDPAGGATQPGRESRARRDLCAQGLPQVRAPG